MCDSSSAICLAHNPVFHGRARHIKVRHHFLRDHVEMGEIEMNFIDTERQLADIFTKPLDSCHFVSLWGGAWCLPSILLGLRGACDLLCIFVSLCFSLAFSSYSPKSPCFTYYTSLYLLNYAYHCARMSSNEMCTFFARPYLITCYDCNVEHMLKLDNSINCFLCF
jgi:hypothetical protein